MDTALAQLKKTLKKERPAGRLYLKDGDKHVQVRRASVLELSITHDFGVKNQTLGVVLAAMGSPALSCGGRL